MRAHTTWRLVRSFLRYLREREGEAALAQLGRELGGEAGALLVHAPQARPGGELVPLEAWLPILRGAEQRWGDPETLRLLRETTRATMAVAVSKGWSTFLADIGPDELLQRSAVFWSMSYDTGTLVVADRGGRHCTIALAGWPSPPREVVAMLAEACVVFMVRLGERTGRAREVEGPEGRAEIEITW